MAKRTENRQDRPDIFKKMDAAASKIGKKEARAILQAADRAYYLESIGFKLFAWQKAVLRNRGTRKVILASRQAGKSTIVAGIIVHTARFEPGSLCIIGAPTENQAAETMHKVIEFIKSDPHYPGLKKCSIEEAELENGSRIIVRTAKSDTFRGYSMPRILLLDEASRIEEEAYTSGALAMMTDNPRGELILISTPNGQDGFFYNAFMSTQGFWQKFFIRSPYQPMVDGIDTTLIPFTDNEKLWRQDQAKIGIHAFFSPRHRDYDYQLMQLAEMRFKQYRQEYCCDFVEAEGQVFTYEEIEGMFVKHTADEIRAHIPQLQLLESLADLRAGGYTA